MIVLMRVISLQTTQTAIYLRPRTVLVMAVARVLALVALLSACSIATPPVQDPNAPPLTLPPEQLVVHFIDDLNQALNDPNITDYETQQRWGMRLGNYFAATERVAQRRSFTMMLNTFANGLYNFDESNEITVEILYTNVDLVSIEGERAEVQIDEGVLQYKRVRTTTDGKHVIERFQEFPLMESIGYPNATIPLIRINGQWFLAER